MSAIASTTPDELYELAQQNRRAGLTVAIRHLADVPGGELTGITRYVDMSRDSEGKLVITGSLVGRLPPKNYLKRYAAAALGCPALREIHETRATLSAAEKLAVGSSNYIDHLLAIANAEAYRRGIFKLVANNPSE